MSAEQENDPSIINRIRSRLRRPPVVPSPIEPEKLIYQSKEGPVNVDFRDGKPYAFLFQGQGSQRPGMTRDIYEQFPEVQELYDRIYDILVEAQPRFPEYNLVPEQSIAELAFDSDQETMNNTANTHLLMAASNAAFYHLIEPTIDGDIEYYAGNSFGQLSAMWAAGALSFENYIVLARIRGILLQEACKANPSFLMAITIPDSVDGPIPEHAAVLDHILAELPHYRGYLEAHNSRSQIIIGARNEDRATIATWLTALPFIRTTPLNTAGAFHSELMLPAVEPFRKVVETITITEPDKPVIDNTTARPLQTEDEFREALIAHLYSPVQWVKTMELLNEQDINKRAEPAETSLLTNMLRHGGEVYHVAKRNKKKIAAGAGLTAALTTLGYIWVGRRRDQND